MTGNGSSRSISSASRAGLHNKHRRSEATGLTKVGLPGAPEGMQKEDPIMSRAEYKIERLNPEAPVLAAFTHGRNDSQYRP
jgi:hypothetical protein